MLENFIATTLRFRWWVIIVSLVFVTSTFMGLERISILSDYKSFLDPEYPGLIEQEKVEAIFTENNRLMIAVAPQDQQVFKPATIRLIQALTNDAWMLPNVSRVDSISNYQHTEATGDDLNVGSLFPDDAVLSQVLMDRASRISALEPLLKDNLVSAKQNVGVISMTFDFPENETLSQANDRSVIAAYALLDKYRAQYATTDFHLSGVMCFDYAFGKYGRQDMATLIPGMRNGGMIATVMVSVVLFVALRCFKLGVMMMLANMVPLLMGYEIRYLING